MADAKKVTVEEIHNKILSGEVKLDLENDFEPTDSQGYSMEGSVVYNGKEHYIYLAFECDDSYELQTAKQIYSDLTK